MSFSAGEACFVQRKVVEGFPELLVRARVRDAVGEARSVRYEGWRGAWEQWRSTSELLPVNQETQTLCEERFTRFRTLARKSRGTTVEDAEAVSKKSKRRRKTKTSADESDFEHKSDESEEDDDDTEPTDAILRLQWSLTLRKLVADDFEKVNHRKLLVRLPKRPSIEGILEDFMLNACSSFGIASSVKPVEAVDLRAVVESLKLIFEQNLKMELLYQFELLQHEAIFSPSPPEELQQVDESDLKIARGRRPVAVYGGEHLLRLCVQLPKILSQTTMLRSEIELVRLSVQDLMRFIARNRDKYVGGGYKSASAEYLTYLRNL